MFTKRVSFELLASPSVGSQHAGVLDVLAVLCGRYYALCSWRYSSIARKVISWNFSTWSGKWKFWLWQSHRCCLHIPVNAVDNVMEVSVIRTLTTREPLQFFIFCMTSLCLDCSLSPLYDCTVYYSIGNGVHRLVSCTVKPLLNLLIQMSTSTEKSLVLGILLVEALV